MAEEVVMKADCGRKAVNPVEEPVVTGAGITGEEVVEEGRMV